ncbi:MAG: DUF2019 domain-containing protein [Planctomycetes bacterium]|nr:DUF2019 domain-containing protein [Planctomycetota bacterium]
MSASALSTLSIDDLLRAYVAAATGHESALDTANPKEADRHNRRAGTIFNELVRREMQHQLLVLLEHNCPMVRLFAAADALKFAPDVAVPVLERLEKDNTGIASLDAKIHLQMWRQKGRRSKRLTH